MRLASTLLIVWNGCCSVAAEQQRLTKRQLTQQQYRQDGRRRRQQQTFCAVCGEMGPSTYPWPDKAIRVSGVPLDTCGQVESSAALLTEGSAFCDVIQAVGPLCGCPVSPTSCSLCWDGSEVTNPQLELPSYPAEDFLPTSLPGVSLSCEVLDAIFKTRDQQDQQCRRAQADAGELCGCPAFPNDTAASEKSNNTLATNTSEPVTDNIFVGDDDDDGESLQCSLCPNGEPPAYPDKPLNVVGSTSYTCSDWDRFASLAMNANDCSLFSSYAKYCGCQVDTFCTMCPLGELAPKPDRSINWYDTAFMSTTENRFHSAVHDYLTCDIMESLVAQPASLSAVMNVDEDLICLSVQLKSAVCGCRPDWRPILLTWSYRLSGILSFIGSSLIMYDVLSRSKNRFTAYHQLVLGISIFDCISSMAYILVGVLAPYEAGFYQSFGNDTTCKVQGFMIQLGQTSMFYNLCLSLYFLLVVRFNWKERQIKIWRWAAHGTALTVGFGMAFGALPFISAQFGVCGILPPLTVNQWQVSLFYTAPVCIVLFVLTAVTVVICWHVSNQHRRVRRWVVESNRKLSLTRKVFWQSFWYVMAFYLTLPCVLVTFYVEYKSQHDFWLLVVAAVLAPLQGLMNALIYFQRSRGTRLSRCWKCLQIRAGSLFHVKGSSTVASSAAMEKAGQAVVSGVIDSKVCEFGSEATISRFEAIRPPPEAGLETENAESSTFRLQSEHNESSGRGSADKIQHDWWQTRLGGLRYDGAPDWEDQLRPQEENNHPGRFDEATTMVASSSVGGERSSAFLGVVEYWDLNKQD